MNSLIRMDDLSLNLRKLEQQEISLRQVARTAQHDLARISVEMTEVERVISRKDDMLAALNQLQLKAQEKNKALFETLLTNLIQEVIPGKNDKVVLTSTVKNNRASLDFDILVNGELENIDEDKGGSIANIVGMGLRFIVLTRHANRRVLLLDEADCHLKSEYIPAFAAVMHQLTKKLGIQVIYISHHSPSNFIGYGRVHEIYREDSKTQSRILHDEELDEDAEESMSAFRYIRLRDYGPHENLLIELSPGLNLITGDNDLGKSKVIQAVVNLMNNEGLERRIRHGRPFFSVEIGLEEGMSLLWQYNRKGSKKTYMALKDANGFDIETSDLGSGVPPWLDLYLAMPLINGENIHYQNQKQQNYLLSSTDFTSIRRAEMLPLGRESRDVHRMIQLFNVRLSGARQQHNQLVKELNNVKNILAIVAPILDEPIDLDRMQEAYKVIGELHQRNEHLNTYTQQIESLSSVLHDIDGTLKEVGGIEVKDVALRASAQMRSTIESLDSIQSLHDSFRQLDSLPESPDVPELHDLKGLTRAGAQIGSLAELLKMLDELSVMEPVEDVQLKGTPEKAVLIEALGAQHKAMEGVNQKLKIVEQTRGQLVQERETLLAKLGGICPTCDKPLEGHVHD